MSISNLKVVFKPPSIETSEAENKADLIALITYATEIGLRDLKSKSVNDNIEKEKKNDNVKKIS